MSVKCPVKIFREFEIGCGAWVYPGEEGQSFLYEVLGDHFQFADVIPLTIPILKDEAFKDWKKFEYWCEQIQLGLMWKLFSGEEGDDAFFKKMRTPKDFFKTKPKAKNRIIELLCDPSSEDFNNVAYVEIINHKKKLFLIYLDLDAWTLGHADSVLVFDSLEQLTPKNGFYPIRKAAL